MPFPGNFDLRAIQTFLAVAETGSMTAAAERLGQTQSTVSKAIGTLEEAIGTVLLDRSLRPMALTPAGHALYDRGQALLGQASEVLTAIQDADHRARSSLTLAMAESFANTVGALLIQEMDHLSERWRLWSGISPHHHAALENRTVDVILSTSEDLFGRDGLEYHPILRESFVAALPRDRTPRVADITEISGLPLLRHSLRSSIGRQVEQQITRLRLHAPFHAEFDTSTAQLTAVANGYGWCMTTPMCLLQDLHLLDHLHLIPIRKGRFTRSATLICRAGDLGSAPAQLAAASRRLLVKRCLPRLFERAGWLRDQVKLADEPR